MRNFLPIFLLVSFASVGAIFYTPALPQIAKDFGSGEGAAQLTITLFLIAYALGQLPYGIIANHMGRKKTIYLGCLIALIGSVICAIAPGYWLLNIGRVIQAVGMAVGLVLAFTLVGDLYEGKAAFRVIAIVTLSFAVLPAIGVAIGGFITQYLGWRYNFWALALYSIGLAGLSTLLPHTGKKIPVSFRSYLHQFTNPFVYIGGTIIGLGTLSIYLFAAEAPFIAHSKLHLTASQFGLYNLISYVGTIVGGILCAIVAHRFSKQRSIVFSLVLITVSALFMLMAFVMGGITIWTLFIPAGVIFFAIPFEYTALSSTILANSPDKPNASSAMGFLNMGWATIGVLILSLVDPQNVVVMPAIMTSAAASMIILYLILSRLNRLKSVGRTISNPSSE